MFIHHLITECFISAEPCVVLPNQVENEIHQIIIQKKREPSSRAPLPALRHADGEGLGVESGAGVDARVEVGPRAFGGRGRGLVAVGIAAAAAAAVGGVAAAVAAIGSKAAPELGGVILVL